MPFLSCKPFKGCYCVRYTDRALGLTFKAFNVATSTYLSTWHPNSCSRNPTRQPPLTLHGIPAMPSEPLVDATAMAMIPLCIQMVSFDSQLSLHPHYKACLMKSRQKESPQCCHLHKAVSRLPRKLGIFFFFYFFNPCSLCKISL